MKKKKSRSFVSFVAYVNTLDGNIGTGLASMNEGPNVILAIFAEMGIILIVKSRRRSA